MTSNNRKINIYSEDAEARYFIRHMLADYKDHFRLLDIKLGGESLMNLLYNDPDYFKNVLFILDGDKDLAKKRCSRLVSSGAFLECKYSGINTTIYISKYSSSSFLYLLIR